MAQKKLLRDILMPFKKIGPNKYTSPSGRKFSGQQVKMYYATNGFQQGGGGGIMGPRMSGPRPVRGVPRPRGIMR